VRIAGQLAKRRRLIGTAVCDLSSARKRQLRTTTIDEHALSNHEKRQRRAPTIPYRFAPLVFDGRERVDPGVNRFVNQDALRAHIDKYVPATTEPATAVSDHWVPTPSIQDFVATLRENTTAPGSRFQWPSSELNLQKLIEIAMHHLPPWTMFGLVNAQPEPTWARDQYTMVVYHGTYPENVLSIVQDGFMCVGSTDPNRPGQYDVAKTFLRMDDGSLPPSVPGVFCSTAFQTAAGYPRRRTSMSAPCNCLPRTAHYRCAASFDALPTAAA
jgi:hypothetical protein